jgi:uncharacterized protein (DUF983 family)
VVCHPGVFPRSGSPAGELDPIEYVSHVPPVPLGAAARCRMNALQGIRRQLCPRCRRGTIFRVPLWRGILDMHERCPVCALKYEREPGYFIGAIYIGYALMLPFVTLIYLALWYFSEWPAYAVLLGTIVAFLPLVPAAVRWGRVLWLYLERSLDPE